MDAPAGYAYPRAMRLLALDGSLARASAALWVDGAVVARRAVPGDRVQPTVLPVMAQELLAEAGRRLDAVAVVVGPGSFTGLRSATALAEGIALGLGVTVIGVTTGEALAAALPPALCEGREVWAAVDTKRGRVALERIVAGIAAAPPTVFAEADLPRPDGPVTVVGDAAPVVAARLLARGCDAVLSDSRLPDAGAAALVAALRFERQTPMRGAAPIYAEPPAVRRPG
ncbi:tRNA (adenosine(37)-N6)-threonylcarbamoyltransferase complex dimerization subunit type 1 TsaB [Roseomonas sp. AR75]|uniref:tRNA (adenosine(37)-N6)-threonylcarbamoyltransferase complex dimerization subunit type 1 TsaB n=1 Tax=Roseomonas sp. AR75 TaxID=2562311 RepID=UPI001485B3E2|nr:tRNA (adenosine(37)-N6)-threonylcarbamoyltransferase complex dimerization subunit type 1 TsaB [Roseomonas sp. AR75]